jgi:hypothetical protein
MSIFPIANPVEALVPRHRKPRDRVAFADKVDDGLRAFAMREMQYFFDLAAVSFDGVMRAAAANKLDGAIDHRSPPLQ